MEDNPSIIAASSLYMSSVMWGRHVSQAKAADAAGVARSTLRGSFKRMVMDIFAEIGKCCKVPERR